MRDDVIQSHRITSDPSENTFALLRTMVREFTVLDFENLVRKLDRFWIGLRNGRLKMSRHSCESDGYKTTIGYHFYEDFSQLSGSVSVNYHGAENGSTNKLILLSNSINQNLMHIKYCSYHAIKCYMYILYWLYYFENTLMNSIPQEFLQIFYHITQEIMEGAR